MKSPRRSRETGVSAKAADVGTDREETGSVWGRLLDSLRDWLRRHVPRLESEDLVGEAALRTWSRFRSAAPWQDLWSWALAVLKNLLVQQLRALGLPRNRLDLDLDGLVAPRHEASSEAVELHDTVAHLRSRLATAEQQTLALLAVGVTANQDIAAMRGVGVRAVEMSRERLRWAARQGISADAFGFSRCQRFCE